MRARPGGRGCPDRADRAGIVAREFEARPVGQGAMLLRHRLSEDRMGRIAREAFEILAMARTRASQAAGESPKSHCASFFTRAVMSTTTARRSALRPARRSARGWWRRRTSRRRSRPQGRARGQLGDVGGHPLDGRRGAVPPRTRRGRADRERSRGGRGSARPEQRKKPACAITRAAARWCVPLPVSR